MNSNERLALYKIAQYIAPHKPYSVNSLYHLCNALSLPDITHKSLGVEILAKYYNETHLCNFLISVYENHFSVFPVVLKESLRRTFIGVEASFGGNYKKKKKFTNTLRRFMGILGFEFTVEYQNRDLEFFDIEVFQSEINDGRREERTILFNILEKQFPEEHTSLTGAYERYINGGTNANRMAIDSCRNAYENFFKKITKKETWKEGLKKLTKSTTLITMVKETYKYLSGYGTHSKRERSREDTFLAIRLTEDILIRILMETGKF